MILAAAINCFLFSMVKIFLRNQPQGGSFLLDREGKKRLVKVMRLKPGDELLVFSAFGKWECRLVEIFPDGARLEIIRQISLPSHSKLQVVIGQSMIKMEHFEWLIQKATELGAAEIFPVISNRSVVRPSNIETKFQRWNQIAEQA